MDYTNSWALVIGIDKYENVSTLTNAVNDAKKFSGLLKKNWIQCN